MLKEFGPIEARIRVIVAPKIPDGFLGLLEHGRLDFTAEAVVLDYDGDVFLKPKSSNKRGSVYANTSGLTWPSLSK
jgi:hypothetical protein